MGSPMQAVRLYGWNQELRLSLYYYDGNNITKFGIHINL